MNVSDFEYDHHSPAETEVALPWFTSLPHRLDHQIYVLPEFLHDLEFCELLRSSCIKICSNRDATSLYVDAYHYSHHFLLCASKHLYYKILLDSKQDRLSLNDNLA
jgi:hypothetical protein